MQVFLTKQDRPLLQSCALYVITGDVVGVPQRVIAVEIPQPLEQVLDIATDIDTIPQQQCLHSLPQRSVAAGRFKGFYHIQNDNNHIREKFRVAKSVPRADTSSEGEAWEEASGW